MILATNRCLFPAGSRVRVHGLESPTGCRFNGVTGTVAPDQTGCGEGRVAVLLPGLTEATALKRANLTLLRVAPVDGSGGAAAGAPGESKAEGGEGSGGRVGATRAPRWRKLRVAVSLRVPQYPLESGDSLAGLAKGQAGSKVVAAAPPNTDQCKVYLDGHILPYKPCVEMGRMTAARLAMFTLVGTLDPTRGGPLAQQYLSVTPHAASVVPTDCDLEIECADLNLVTYFSRFAQGRGTRNAAPQDGFGSRNDLTPQVHAMLAAFGLGQDALTPELLEKHDLVDTTPQVVGEPDPSLWPLSQDDPSNYRTIAEGVGPDGSYSFGGSALAKAPEEGPSNPDWYRGHISDNQIGRSGGDPRVFGAANLGLLESILEQREGRYRWVHLRSVPDDDIAENDLDLRLHGVHPGRARAIAASRGWFYVFGGDNNCRHEVCYLTEQPAEPLLDEAGAVSAAASTRPGAPLFVLRKEKFAHHSHVALSDYANATRMLTGSENNLYLSELASRDPHVFWSFLQQLGSFVADVGRQGSFSKCITKATAASGVSAVAYHKSICRQLGAAGKGGGPCVPRSWGKTAGESLAAYLYCRDSPPGFLPQTLANLVALQWNFGPRRAPLPILCVGYAGDSAAWGDACSFELETKIQAELREFHGSGGDGDDGGISEGGGSGGGGGSRAPPPIGSTLRDMFMSPDGPPSGPAAATVGTVKVRNMI